MTNTLRWLPGQHMQQLCLHERLREKSLLNERRVTAMEECTPPGGKSIAHREGYFLGPF